VESLFEIDIPKRALFKAAEVCDLVKLQPYVLRSWEAEFPNLGVARSAGGPRVYRRADVEQVLRIKHLLLDEGLTLAGVRRKLEEEEAPVAEEPAIAELLGRNARERLTQVKRGLQSLLELLESGGGNGRELAHVARVARPAATAASRSNGRRTAPKTAKRAVARRAGPARRKRS
jgi:DNA-binding transcriptional MerR regulator